MGAEEEGEEEGRGGKEERGSGGTGGRPAMGPAAAPAGGAARHGRGERNPNPRLMIP